MADSPETQNPAAPQEAPEPLHWAVEALNAQLPGAVLETKNALNETTITVVAESIREVMAVLKTAGINFMEDVTCVDCYPAEPRFEVVYHLLNMTRKQRLRVKVQLNSGDTAVNSITPVWPSADFYEREVFDLFGIRFGGHPNMRRILMPDDWQGNPLRKDYPVEGYR